MARITDMMESKYLKQGDIADGEAVVTIKKVGKANIAREDEPAEYKWLVRFAEFERPMVLNRTNIEALGEILGDESDDWIGQSVVVYVDENVSYAGKRVGGLRIKAVRKSPNAPSKRAESQAVADMDDDVPF